MILVVLLMLVLLMIASSLSSCHAFITNNNQNIRYEHQTSLYSSQQTSTIKAIINKSYSRQEAKDMVANTLCPPNEERDRSTAGMEAYGEQSSSSEIAITNDDPRTEYTFDQFPLDSFDILVDRALDFVDDDDGDGECRTLVDLGSGCGRLCFYAALTRGGMCENKTRRWNVNGVEIGSKLHSLAVKSLERGINNGWFDESSNKDCPSSSQIAFLNGNALQTDDPYYKTDTHINNNIQSLLSKANILFCYSTVWEAETDFNPEISAMLLHEKWSKSLANACSNGCLAVTTDRALNPIHGWKLVERIDVRNPSVWGSTGYISILEK